MNDKFILGVRGGRTFSSMPECVVPRENMRSVSGTLLFKGLGYPVTRRTRDHIVIDIGHGEEKVRKDAHRVTYSLMGRPKEVDTK